MNPGMSRRWRLGVHRLQLLAVVGIGLAFALPRVEAAPVAADWTSSPASATLGTTTGTTSGFGDPSLLNTDCGSAVGSASPPRAGVDAAEGGAAMAIGGVTIMTVA
jgi:hypothetical protein